jgi:hypothetical protein
VIIIPLWLAVLILVITRPVYGLKMIFGFALGGAIGLFTLALIAAAYLLLGACRSASGCAIRRIRLTARRRTRCAGAFIAAFPA